MHTFSISTSTGNSLRWYLQSRNVQQGPIALLLEAAESSPHSQEKHNQIERDAIYDKLREFELTLKALWAALKRRLELRKEHYEQQKEKLDYEDCEKQLKRLENFHEAKIPTSRVDTF